MKHSQNVPLWEKYTLTVEEAAAYFRIGEHKLRRLISENKNADYLLWNGNRVQIKSVNHDDKMYKNHAQKMYNQPSIN